MPRREEDGRKWLGRPKLCTKSCRATQRKRDVKTIYTVVESWREDKFSGIVVEELCEDNF